MEYQTPGMEFFLNDKYRGMGLSKGLTRGIQVKCEGHILTQEGMGIGTIGLKQKGLAYFSRGMVQEPEGNSYTCDIDTVLISAIMRIPSRMLSYVWHFGTAIYMALPIAQHRLLSISAAIRRIFRVDNRFIPTTVKGIAHFQYIVQDTGLAVDCSITVPENNGTLCIMNEMGADWFGFGNVEGKLTESPPAWEVLDELRPYPSLYSEQLELLFSLRDIIVSGSVPYKVFWGREQGKGLCWAGYTIEIDLKQSPDSVVRCSYRIEFEKLRREESIGWKSASS